MSEHNEGENLRIVDTSDTLTIEELRELKKLASLSKTTRVVVGVAFAIVGVMGFPTVIEWLAKYIH